MSAPAIEDGFKIAVLIPCYNQAETIGAIVSGFREALPSARIFVFDNNSTDDTARVATREGARVYREARQGKGNVVRRMFADIDADIYVLVEGDGSYDPADAPSLVNALVTEHVDMVVGTRRGLSARHGREDFGERAFEWLYRRFFAGASSDIDLRLPRRHAPLREELSGDLDRLRRRGRAFLAREPADDSGRRDRA